MRGGGQNGGERRGRGSRWGDEWWWWWLACAREGEGFTPTCSTKVTASGTVSAILLRTITMGSRRLQKAEVETSSSCDRDFFVDMIPMFFSFSRIKSVISILAGSSAASVFSMLTSLVISPATLLYLL